MEKEQTLAIIKPDGIEHTEEIIDILYKNGLTIVDYDLRLLDEEIVADHYSHLIDKPFFPEIIEYMTSAPVVLMILEGENAVSTLRKVMGPTDSTQAAPDTIRGKFGTDKSTNAIHGSDSVENAQIEIKRFFGGRERKRNN